jgi:hypothetical protein
MSSNRNIYKRERIKNHKLKAKQQFFSMQSPDKMLVNID